LLGSALRGVEIAVSAILAVSLCVAGHRFALLHRYFMRRFGLRNCDLEIALCAGLARLLRLVGSVLGVVIRLRLRNVLLSIGYVFAGVGLRIGDVALRVRARLGHVVLHFGGRFCLLQPTSARPAAATIQNTLPFMSVSSISYPA
jgi:hypothetical protein